MLFPDEVEDPKEDHIWGERCCLWSIFTPLEIYLCSTCSSSLEPLATTDLSPVLTVLSFLEHPRLEAYSM